MTDEKRPLKVFLCHASADKPRVRELYRYLKRRGLQPWLDAEDLLPGQNWQVEIPKALETSDAIIICLSKGSVDKEGYVQKEIKFALDKALEMPEGRIFLIPARLEECDVPRSLSGYHWVDLFDESGYSKLMKSLKVRASQLERAAVQVSKQDENSSYLVEKPKQESREGVVVHVNGNVQGNIIIGNDNAVQSQTAQPESEKQVESKPPLVVEKKEPEKPISPSLAKKKQLQKPPRKLSTGYIVAILVAAAILVVIVTILAALIGILPQFFKPSPAPISTITATMTITQAPTTRVKQWSSPPPMVIDVGKQYFATFKMAKGGEFVIQLFPDKAPITVNNFIFLAKQGYYDGTTFHRVLEGFMAQGGDPTGTGMGSPGYEFKNEDSDLKFDKPGVVAMANVGRDTNGSQFFITFLSTEYLNGGYTIFGQIISGMDVVNGITRRDPQTNPTFIGDMIETVKITEK